MNKLTLFLLSLMIVLSVSVNSGCTGYEDGPNFNFKSAETKISNTWKVKEAALNGNDITGEFEGDSFRFLNNGDYERRDAERQISVAPFTQNVTQAVDGVGKWELLETNTLELLYTYSFKDPFNPDITYTEDVNEIWEIRRLTTEEFWLLNDGFFLKLIPSGQ